MTILVWALLIAVILPILAKAPLAVAMFKAGGYDNNHPRDQENSLTGFGARALAAHQNAFESLIIFAPAILLAMITGNTGELIQQLAMAHIAARVVYNLLYLADQATLRSLVWMIATGCSIAIIVISIP